MKTISFWLLAIFISMACASSSTNIDLQNGKEVRKILASNWEAEYIENIGSRNKVPESMVSEIDLQENGSYTVGVKNGTIKRSGKWSYEPTTHMLTITIGSESASSRILQLTKKKLISSEYTTFNNVIRDSTVVTYKRI
jgi:hypothetical protein